MDDALQVFLSEMSELPEFLGFASVGVQTRGHFNNTPLHVAAIRGDSDIITRLLDAGAEIDAAAEHGYTALHEAVEQCHRETVEVLVQRGASLSATNDNGDTPLALAQFDHHPELERLLQANVG